MPITSGSQSLLASIPTFMSVFRESIPSRNTGLARPPFAGSSTCPTSPRSSHQANSSCDSSNSALLCRRGSGATLRSESTESSPTTTISTIESSLTEPSPSSSPESPGTLRPLSHIKDTKLSTTALGSSLESGLPSSPHPSPGSFSSSPSSLKKPRNLKNLSVNTNTSGVGRTGSVSSLPRMVSSDLTPESIHPLSAPTSPSFIIPHIPKRRPSNLGLSLTTVDASGTSLKSSGAMQTPAMTRLHKRSIDLTHSTGPMIFSPAMGPEGGMHLPRLHATPLQLDRRTSLPVSHHTSFDSASSSPSPIVQQTLNHVPEEVDHDVPLSREIPSPAYPNGPVCIYSPGVYLFLEPKDIEASEFDVVINVAREVLNPFAHEQPTPKYRDVGVQVNLYEEDAARAAAARTGVVGSSDNDAALPTAIPHLSFASSWHGLPVSTPETARAGPRQPEYIHVPWEHNTKVSVELLDLCELIDDRVKQGKRVLIHCQCGVSRSASLIIAYGLYKNPEWSDSDAYNTVKERSRWINPNMHFIFELHAFKQILMERKLKAKATARVHHTLLRTTTDSVLPSTSRFEAVMSSVEEPQSAPLRDSDLASPTSISPPLSAMPTELPDGAKDMPGPSMQFDTRSPFRSGVASLDMLTRLGASSLSPPPTGTSSLTPPRTGIPSLTLLPTGVPRLPQIPPKLPKGFMTLDSTIHSMPTTTRPENRLSSIAPGFDFGLSPSPNPAHHHSRPHLAPLTINNNDGKPARTIVAGDERESLPAPNLHLPIPPRTLRPSPSLPAGFSGLKRRGDGVHALPSQLATVTLPRLNTLLGVEDVVLMSPRAAQFVHPLLHRTAAGDLAAALGPGFGLRSTALGEKKVEIIPRATEMDPRSPAAAGEMPITRSIDGLL